MSAMAEMTTSDLSKCSITNGCKEKQQCIVDLNNRDINHLNDILKDVVSFNDIIGEPEPGIFAMDRVWVVSYHTYTATKFWCYRILTLLFAVPCAIWWAITFGCCSFCNIWCCIPCVKCYRIQCNPIGQIWQFYIQTFLHPVIDAFGRLCTNRVKVGISNDLKSEKYDNVHIA